MTQAGQPPTRGGLGRGLDALIQRGQPGTHEIELARIQPNPAQPRQQFDADALQELADSIRLHGVLQPVVVARTETGYSLIAGERRWRAARLAGLTSIPAVVKDASPANHLELALVENVQRADLTPLEEASAYRTLIDDHRLTQEQVATRVGRSRVAITNRLRLLTLPPGARALLAAGSLSEGHARALLGITDALTLDALAADVVRRQLSVRETEELVRRLSATPPVDTPDASATAHAAPELTPLEDSLRQVLGTRVQIQQSRRGGKLVIHYYDADQLEGLIERLLGKEAL